MTCRPAAIALMLLISSIGDAALGAGTLSVVPDSASALGGAGGRFANLNDASALRVSPANIADKTQSELLLNLGVWHGDISFDSVNGASLEMDKPWVYPGSIYAVMPIEPGKVALGFGISTPFGLSIVYPRNSDPRLRYAVAYDANLLTVDFTPALAFKATDSLSFGLGLDVIYSDLQIKRVYPWRVYAPGAHDGEAEFQGDGWGLGAYAGINWEITKHQRVALVGRLPVQVEYDGDFTTSGMPSSLQAAGYTQRSDFESDITFPGSLALGYGIDVTDRLTVGFDLQWAANSSHDDIPLNVGGNQALLPRDRVDLDWKNSFDVGTGISYALSEQWTLRCGYLFSENSVGELNYIPSVPSYDRHVFSLGVGWKGRCNSIDLAYAFVYNPTREVTGAAQPEFNGSYDHQWHVLSLSITHRF
jgi:long-chain fatty acid transport protein